MKSAVIAARDNEPGDTRLKPAGFNGDQMTSDPDYDQPLVKELELVLVVFDILYCRGQVPYPLSHFCGMAAEVIYGLAFITTDIPPGKAYTDVSYECMHDVETASSLLCLGVMTEPYRGLRCMLIHPVWDHSIWSES